MLKSIFIPSDDFFTNWLDDLNEYFGNAFGILYYPFELLISFLNRVNQINDTTSAIISIPEFKLNFMGYEAVLFAGFTYNLNDILQNDTFNNLHTIYLTVVDILLWLSLVYLASNCLRNVIGGMGNAVSDTIYDSDEAQDERAYQSYARSQKAQNRYNQEQYEKSNSAHKNKIGF